MTTVAANRECMAADRHYSLDGPSFKATKLWIHDGSIWSSAGGNADWLVFQRYVLGVDKERPIIKDEDGFCVLRLSKDGMYYYDWSCLPTKIDDQCFAIGAGQLAALCLMDVGLSPKEAVTRVCARDDNTKGPVDCVFLAEVAAFKKPRTRKGS